MSKKPGDAVVFDGDDAGYLAWLDAHREGYVLNTRRPGGDPKYIVLHQKTCPHISRRSQRPGAWTEGAYLKVCATSLVALESAARRFGRPDGSFSKRCSFCG